MRVVLFCVLIALPLFPVFAGVEYPSGVSVGNKNNPRVSLSGFSRLSQVQREQVSTTISAFTSSFGNQVFLPTAVSVVKSQGGPKYEFGVVSAGLPYSVTLDGKLHTKSFEKSLPLLLHEVSHQIAESQMYSIFTENRPQVLWALASRFDDRGRDGSLAFIESTKQKLGQTRSAEEILEEYFMIGVYSDLVHELLADTYTVAFLVSKNTANAADAIYENIAFPGLRGSEAGEQNKQAKYRRFNSITGPLTPGEISESAESSHTATYIARNFVWKNLLKSTRPPSMHRFGNGMLNALVNAYAELTQDFTKEPTIFRDGSYDVPTLNRAFIKAICAEFRISPCSDMALGPIN